MARFDIFIPASRSLKGKRQVVRSLVANVQNKFNVSIAEVEYQELWQRSALGVSCVAESSGHCRRVLQEVEKLMGRVALGNAEIIDRSVEVVALEDL